MDPMRPAIRLFWGGMLTVCLMAVCLLSVPAEADLHDGQGLQLGVEYVAVEGYDFAPDYRGYNASDFVFLRWNGAASWKDRLILDYRFGYWLGSYTTVEPFHGGPQPVLIGGVPDPITPLGLLALFNPDLSARLKILREGTNRLTLSLGHLSFKTNPQSRVFGEYLYGTDLYPVNHAGANPWSFFEHGTVGSFFGQESRAAPARSDFQGLLLEHGFGDWFSQFLGVEMEVRRSPIFDLSFSYRLETSKIQGLHLALGLQWYRAVRNTEIVLKDREGGYAFSGDTLMLFGWEHASQIRGFYGDRISETRGDSLRLIAKGTSDDSLRAQALGVENQRLAAMRDEKLAPYERGLRRIEASCPADGPSCPGGGFPPPDLAVSYLPTSGLKTSVAFSLDPKSLLGFGGSLGQDDWMLYGEAAVLGWEDSPLYDASILERIPFMFGIVIPTFRVLDRLAVETEHYPWELFAGKDESSHGSTLYGLPFLAPALREEIRVDSPWRLAVHAEKSWLKRLRLQALAAYMPNQHLGGTLLAERALRHDWSLAVNFAWQVHQ